MGSRRLALILGTFPPAMEAVAPFNPPTPRPATDLQPTTLSNLLLHLRSDEDLALALREGNTEALTVLFKRHSPLLFGIARRILRLDGEAEDCVQQIFLDVFRSIHQFDSSKGAFKTWLLLFAYHRTLNRRRWLTAAHIFDAEPLDELSHTLLQADTSTNEQLIDRILLERSLATLQPRQRRTIELTYFEGLTADEIAARTGETVRVVRHNLYRGLDRLRQQLCPSPDAPRKGDHQ